MRSLIGLTILVIIIAVLLFGFSSFVIMVLSGAIGHAFDNKHFLINYGQAILVTLALSIVSAFFNFNRK